MFSAVVRCGMTGQANWMFLLLIPDSFSGPIHRENKGKIKKTEQDKGAAIHQTIP